MVHLKKKNSIHITNKNINNMIYKNFVYLYHKNALTRIGKKRVFILFKKEKEIFPPLYNEILINLDWEQNKNKHKRIKGSKQECQSLIN